MIPLTKTFDLQSDYVKLAGPLLAVDRHDLSTQGEHRRWEYTMALTAIHQHGKDQKRRIVDVGGSGSPLGNIIQDCTAIPVTLVDPKDTIPLHEVPSDFDVVLCISVLEHVKELEEFCDDLVRITAPGGLLFLTMDIWGEPAHVPDAAHYNWLRERLFTLESWKWLAATFYRAGFGLLGEADWGYHGDALFPLGYSLCSLALVKGE